MAAKEGKKDAKPAGIGHFSLRFEVTGKGGERAAVIGYQDGEHAKRFKLGTVKPDQIETELGPQECWAFSPQEGGRLDLERVRRKTMGEVQRAVSRAIFEALVSPLQAVGNTVSSGGSGRDSPNR